MDDPNKEKRRSARERCRRKENRAVKFILQQDGSARNDQRSLPAGTVQRVAQFYGGAQRRVLSTPVAPDQHVVVVDGVAGEPIVVRGTHSQIVALLRGLVGGVRTEDRARRYIEDAARAGDVAVVYVVAGVREHHVPAGVMAQIERGGA